MGFSDADDFVDDAGPAFDPKLVPELELAGEEEPDELLELGWQEAQIKELLTTQGSATNYLLRITDDDETWKHTKEDLAAIAPPLTRILNRYDVTRAAAAAGDELALVVAVSNYGIRNYTQRSRLIRRYREIEEPISGIPEREPTEPTWSEADERAFYDEPGSERPPVPNLRPRGI
jgi:hypothetical protein